MHDDVPTLLHVTHAKAGSQWLHKILLRCAPERIVVPRYRMVQFFEAPVQRGMIYPTLYLTREEVDRVALPPGSRRLVVIRDLRDTLISWYFSLKVSHVVDDPLVAAYRTALNARDFEDGLLWALDDKGFDLCAAIQRSWLGSGERLIRYEDLLVHDQEILEPVLLDECRLPVSRDRFREVVRATRFESLTGRRRGVEDVTAHERKGIAGDWRNHFTSRIVQAFKARHADLLVATGYETGTGW